MLWPFAPAICFFCPLLSSPASVTCRFHPQAATILTRDQHDNNRTTTATTANLLLPCFWLPLPSPEPLALQEYAEREAKLLGPVQGDSSPGTLHQHIDRYKGESCPLAINSHSSSRKAATKALPWRRGIGLRKIKKWLTRMAFKSSHTTNTRNWRGNTAEDRVTGAATEVLKGGVR